MKKPAASPSQKGRSSAISPRPGADLMKTIPVGAAHKSIPVGAAHKSIHVRGAREHNLKNVDLEIPRDALVVFTGL